MSAYRLLFLWSLYGCGLSSQTKNSSLPDPKSLDPELMKLSEKELKALITSKKQEAQNLKMQLAKAQKVHSALCYKVQEMSRTCYSLIWLLSESSSDSLSCKGGPAQQQHVIETELITSQPGEFFLILNDHVVSSLFASGKQILAFQSLGDAGIRLALGSVYKMIVKRNDGSKKMPDLNDFHLSIYIDNTLVFETLDKIDDTQYQIDLSPLLAMQQSPACKIDSAAIAKLEQEAIN
jgi:hypothetical protein